ncbi:hypothetical protein PMAYCL1PPCAC_24473, partial [Pristionchus mayeri]
VVREDVFVSFVTIILGAAVAAAAAEGGDTEGVTIVVGRTGVMPSRWGELLSFLMPPLLPLPPLPGVPPPPPPRTTEGVFRRDSIEVAASTVTMITHFWGSRVPGEVLPEALLPGGDGEREERIESGEAARRPLNLKKSRRTLPHLVSSSNSCSAWGETRSRELTPPPPNIDTDGEEFL